jgi:hypothetical protein
LRILGTLDNGVIEIGEKCEPKSSILSSDSSSLQSMSSNQLRADWCSWILVYQKNIL